MGKMAEETVEIGPDTLDAYLRSNTRVFAKVGEYTYYVTHTDGYWRIQDCANLNEMGTSPIALTSSPRSTRSSTSRSTTGARFWSSLARQSSSPA